MHLVHVQPLSLQIKEHKKLIVNQLRIQIFELKHFKLLYNFIMISMLYTQTRKLKTVLSNSKMYQYC